MTRCLLAAMLIALATPALAQTCLCPPIDDEKKAARVITGIYEATPVKAENQEGDEIEPGQAAVRGEIEVVTFEISGVWQGRPLKTLRVVNQPGACAVGMRLKQKLTIAVKPIMPATIRSSPLRDMKVGWTTDFCLVDLVNRLNKDGKLAEYLNKPEATPP